MESMQSFTKKKLEFHGVQKVKLMGYELMKEEAV